MSRIRHLLVFVDEPDATIFTWDICEIRGDSSAWRHIVSGLQGYTTWIDAWRAGHAVLLTLVNDQSTGPRSTDEDDGGAAQSIR